MKNYENDKIDFQGFEQAVMMIDTRQDVQALYKAALIECAHNAIRLGKRADGQPITLTQKDY